jgi:methyl-accepting chemotaxis protein
MESLDANKYNNEFASMVTSLNEMRAAIEMLISDSKLQAAAIVQGRYTDRADIEKHKGVYRDILAGMNMAADAFVHEFDEMPCPVMRIDKEYNIIYINVTGARLLGKSQQQLVGTKCYDAFKTDDCKTDKCACYRAMQTETAQESETTARPNEKLTREIKYVGVPSYENEEVIGALEIVTDLTDIKAAKRLVEKQAEELQNLLAEVDLAAEQVASGTQQVSDGNQAISQGATEQAASIEELTSTITQIAAQTRQNALSAGKANEMSEQAKQNAVQGNERMKALQQAMSEINESSANISKIIKVIDDIAFQTNILALNAAVEAARAGIHGKGFAVVAEEVRNLAARSAGAAKETTEMIEGSIKKTEAGNRIADETAAALTRIVEGVEKAVELVAEIAGASNQQATAIGEVNRGIEQMSQVVQTNSATSQEAAAAAEELSSQAAMLKDLVDRFKLQDTQTKKLDAPKKAPALKQGKGAMEINLSDQEYGKY